MMSTRLVWFVNAIILAVMAAAALPAVAGAADPGTWSSTDSMSVGRIYHTATLLTDGRVLVAGGSSNASASLASAEIYNPATGTWSSTGSMNVARMRHTATLLPDGRVLVAGGVTGAGYTASTELYDPVSGTWSYAASMGAARGEHTATLLGLTGKVLVVGGDTAAGATASSELYNPGADAWSYAGSMGTARREHSAALLPDGLVLVAGGYTTGSAATASAELYDPSASGGLGGWVLAGTMAAARYGHTATTLPGGKILVAGGRDGSTYLDSTEVYDSPTDAWSASGTMSIPHWRHTATLLLNGKVLVAGGRSANTSGYHPVAELYDAATDQFTTAAAMISPHSSHTATLLSDGTVLVVGGFTGSVYTATAELYTPMAVGPAVTVAPAFAQYSDCVGLEATITPAGLTGNLVFWVNDSTKGLLGKPSYDATSGAGSQGYRVCLPAGEYAIGVDFSQEGTSTVVSGESTLTVVPESMTILPNDRRNPTSLHVPRVGGPSGAFALVASFAQEKDGCYGIPAGTPVSCELVPLVGGPVTAAQSGDDALVRRVRLAGLGPLALPAAFLFRAVPAGTYSVVYRVDENARFGAESVERTLEITEPPLVWQAWIEPKQSRYARGQTIPVAFLLKYGVQTDQATLTVTGPGGVVAVAEAPMTYDPASGRHRLSGGLITAGWAKGTYTLRVTLPTLATQSRAMTLK